MPRKKSKLKNLRQKKQNQRPKQKEAPKQIEELPGRPRRGVITYRRKDVLV
jgi:hypothetical protein